MILNCQRAVRVAPRPLANFLRRVEKELGIHGSGVTVCFVSDAEIARMNRQYRKKKGPTDVLSFPQENSFSPLVYAQRSRRANHLPAVAGHSPARRGGLLRAPKVTSRAKVGKWLSRESKPAYLGDIAIAPKTARRYAKKNGRRLDSELRVLMLHGVLHLLGYDHETDRGQMSRLENKLRRRFGLV